MTFRRNPLQTTYRIGTTTLESVSSIRDLGIILDHKLTFSDNINRTVSKANKTDSRALN